MSRIKVSHRSAWFEYYSVIDYQMSIRNINNYDGLKRTIVSQFTKDSEENYKNFVELSRKTDVTFKKISTSAMHCKNSFQTIHTLLSRRALLIMLLGIIYYISTNQTVLSKQTEKHSSI